MNADPTRPIWQDNPYAPTSPAQMPSAGEVDVRDRAVEERRICPWCLSYLQLTNTRWGVFFVCSDEFTTGCKFTTRAKWINPKVRYVAEDVGDPRERPIEDELAALDAAVGRKRAETVKF